MKVKNTIASVAVLLVTACASIEVPQSREDLKNVVEPETIVVNRGYGTVLDALERNTVMCFNKAITLWGQGHSQGTITYRSSLRKTTAKKSELTVQIQMSPVGGVRQPGGGFYALAADIAEVAGGRTSVALNGSAKGPYGDIYRTTKAWIEGTNVSCPKLVGE